MSVTESLEALEKQQNKIQIQSFRAGFEAPASQK